MSNYHFDLTGRTALVTGASSGIGRRFAMILAASGAKVVLAARRVNLLADLKAEIEAAGGTAVAVAMDVVDEASVIAAYDEAEKQIGPIDTVIANAGISIMSSLLKMSTDDFDTVTDVSLKGVFLSVREGVRRMAAANVIERGRVVIISSITSTKVYDGIAAYSAAKAAAIQLGRVSAKDWARRGVNVNILCPGYIQTELTEELWESDFGKGMLANFPRRRIMDADALDAMLLYLCSDVSAQVTGSVFTIDDGQSLA